MIENIEETKHLDTVLKLIEEKDINAIFKHFWAKLHIVEWWEYAWIECGKMSYYFHSSKWKDVIKEEYETIWLEKRRKTIVPYDWWEYLI